MKEVTTGVVKGRRTEGTLLVEPIARRTKKSAFLRRLERLQAPQPLPAGVTPIGVKGSHNGTTRK